MFKLLSILALALCVQMAVPSQAQRSRITKPDLQVLHRLNDSLGKAGATMLDALLPQERMRADSLFTRLLVRAMQVPYSFYYTFDSAQMAPMLYPPDSSFRIITWHYALTDDEFRQKGAIQINTPDGRLKLFPLFDASEYTQEPADSVRDSRHWIGAVYYALVANTVNGKPVYTLLGYDENNGLTTRKWMDILTFNEAGEPQWGGHQYFDIRNDSLFPKTRSRYVMEYKKEGRARLNYDPEEQMIIMDYLISETNEPEKLYTLVPGGDYSGFKWQENRWVYIDRLATDNLGDGNAPKPMTIFTDMGDADEEALQKQSDKNMQKPAATKAPAKAPAKTPIKKKGGK